MARFDGQTTRQRATKMVIGELSGVTVPAHTGADVTIFKTKDPKDLIKISFEEALGQIEQRNAMQEIIDQFWTLDSAFSRSVYSILENPDEYPDPASSISDSAESFADAVMDLFEEEDLEQEFDAVEAAHALADCFVDGKFDSQEIEKQRRRRRRRRGRGGKYEKDFKPANKGNNREDGIMPETTVSAQEHQAVVDTNTDLKKQLAVAIAFGKFNDAEKAFYGTLDTADAEAFIAKSAIDRKALMQKALDDDPVIYTAEDGREFRKSADPAMVSMAKQLDENNKLIAKQSAQLELQALNKRAQDELSNVKGEMVHKTALLRAVDGIEDEEVRKGVAQIVKSFNSNLAKAFETQGTSFTPTLKSAEAQLDELAKKYQEQHVGTDYATAYTKVLETAKGQDLYAESIKQGQGE